MNETNLTQRGKSTDINALEIFFSLRDTKKLLKKKEFIKNDVLL